MFSAPMTPHRKLTLAISINVGVVLVEGVAGILSGSLSLLSDALHNTADVFSLGMSWLALRLGRRPNDKVRTFGYKRAEILAALFNSFLLGGVAFFLFREAVWRLTHPLPVDGKVMILVAAVAGLTNMGSAFLLRREAHHSLNLRATYWHLMGDALGSLTVVAGGGVILWRGWAWVDPALSLGIGGLVLIQGSRIILSAIHILMQSAPKQLDLHSIQRRLENLPEIHNIHHAHLWQMSEREIFFEAHVNLSHDWAVSQSGQIARRIEKILHDEFGIGHATLQMEYQSCQDVPLVKSPGP